MGVDWFAGALRSNNGQRCRSSSIGLFLRVPSKILMKVAYTLILHACISQCIFQFFEQYSSDLWLLGLDSAFSCTKWYLITWIYNADALHGMRVDATDDTAVENSLTCGIDILLCMKARHSQLWKTCSSRIQTLHDTDPCIRHDTKISALFHRLPPAC